MAETKQIALGTLVKLSISGSFVTQPLVTAATPPPRAREKVEGKALADTFDVPLLGIEEQSVFEFTQFWHPGETEHEKIDTLFGNKNEASWQIVTPHGTPKTMEFTGKVVGVGGEELTQGGTYKRKVQVQRTGEITLS